MNKERTKTTIILINNILISIFIFFIFYFGWIKLYSNIVYFYELGNWLLSIVFITIYSYMNMLYGGYKLGELPLFDILFSQGLSIFISNIFVYIISVFIEKSYVYFIGIIIMILIQATLIFLVCICVNEVYYRFIKPAKTLLITSEENDGFYNKINRYHSKVFNIYSKKIYNDEDIKLEMELYDAIIIDVKSNDLKERIINECYIHSTPLFIVPTVTNILINSSKKQHVIDTPLLSINKFGPSQISKIIKRTLDILVSSLMLILCFPLMVIVGILIKINDGGPILYKQERLTLNGKLFFVLKFRSMSVDAEKDGIARFASSNDNRITHIGKFIRACRIDELPQLINILKGDMSIVGPRPERPEIANKIYEEIPEFKYRLKVKAGLTGYAQVFGKYNTKLNDKLLLDLLYIENYSILLDIKLILLTIKTIFMKESTEGVE